MARPWRIELEGA